MVFIIVFFFIVLLLVFVSGVIVVELMVDVVFGVIDVDVCVFWVLLFLLVLIFVRVENSE